MKVTLNFRVVYKTVLYLGVAMRGHSFLVFNFYHRLYQMTGLDIDVP